MSPISGMESKLGCFWDGVTLLVLVGVGTGVTGHTGGAIVGTLSGTSAVWGASVEWYHKIRNTTKCVLDSGVGFTPLKPLMDIRITILFSR